MTASDTVMTASQRMLATALTESAYKSISLSHWKMKVMVISKKMVMPRRIIKVNCIILRQVQKLKYLET